MITQLSRQQIIPLIKQSAGSLTTG